MADIKISSGTQRIVYAQLKKSLALNNVDNTSDVNKPVSTQQQNALDGKVNANGISEIRKMTQADYNALTTKSATTLYVIVG